MFVRTERLFLRPAWPEDIDELADLLADGGEDDDSRLEELPVSVEDVRACLQRACDPRLPHFFIYLRTPQAPQLVGGIGLAPFEDDAEVGYWIAARHRGHGYAAEALLAVLDQALMLGYGRVVASHVLQEPATDGFPARSDHARRVLERAGFRDTGQERSRAGASQAIGRAVRIFAASLDRCAWMRPHAALLPTGSSTAA